MDLNALFAAHHETLLRYLTRLTGDPEQAADAAQESYLRLVRQPPGRADNLKAWLFTVATNVVRDDWKKRRHAAALTQAPSLAPQADTPPNPQERLERDERRQLVREMLQKLPAKDRTVLLMREEGFSHKEIAATVGTTTGSVGTMIARALRKLANEMTQVAGTLS
jgi:RNA polymerase sigma-70 factor (ECF subfamily)